jgi:zinc transport system substrate-binding protein
MSVTCVQWAGCACAVLATLLAGCKKEELPPPETGGKVVVVASVFPVADLVKQIGGARVEVRCMLEPGRSPHGASPATIRPDVFAGARLLIVVGMGLDDWAAKAAKDAGASVRVVDLTRDPDFLATYATYMGTLPDAAIRDPNLRGGPPASQTAPASRSAATEPAAPPDPHVWMDPIFLQGLEVTVLGELVRADPANAHAYTGDANTFFGELRKLDQEYKQALSAPGIEGHCFLTYHPAFGYLARRYGLTQLALDGSDLAPVSEGRLAEIRKAMKDRKVKAIFTEPQFPAGQLEVLAGEIGVKAGRLDAIGNPYEPEYDSYLAMMRSNLRALVEGIRQGR